MIECPYCKRQYKFLVNKHHCLVEHGVTREILIANGIQVTSDECREISSRSVKQRWKNGVYCNRDQSTRPTKYKRHHSHYPNKSKAMTDPFRLSRYWKNLNDNERKVLIDKANKKRIEFWENISDEDLLNHTQKCIPKPFIEDINNIQYTFRSSWEVIVAKWLTANNIEWTYEKIVINLKGKKHYIPDFYLPEMKILIEVKPSCFVGLNLEKYNAASKIYRTVFITEHDIKRFLLETPEDVLATTWFERTGVNALKTIHIGQPAA